MRYDNDALACLRIRHLNDYLQKCDARLMENSNITRKHVGRGGGGALCEQLWNRSRRYESHLADQVSLAHTRSHRLTLH